MLLQCQCNCTWAEMTNSIPHPYTIDWDNCFNIRASSERNSTVNLPWTRADVSNPVVSGIVERGSSYSAAVLMAKPGPTPKQPSHITSSFNFKTTSLILSRYLPAQGEVQLVFTCSISTPYAVPATSHEDMGKRWKVRWDLGRLAVRWFTVHLESAFGNGMPPTARVILQCSYTAISQLLSGIFEVTIETWSEAARPTGQQWVSARATLTLFGRQAAIKASYVPSMLYLPMLPEALETPSDTNRSPDRQHEVPLSQGEDDEDGWVAV